MSDTTTTTAKSRGPASVRIAIDANGNPAESMSEATGARFIHLTSALKANPKWNKETDAPPAGTFHDIQFGGAGTAVTMAAIFGYQTKSGNIANTINNGDKGDKNANPIPEITAFWTKVENGEWPDKGEGLGGVRYDKDLLALAIANAKGESDPAPYRAKIENDKVDSTKGHVVAGDTKGAITYGAFAMRNPKVKAEYEKLAGTEAAPLDVL